MWEGGKKVARAFQVRFSFNAEHLAKGPAVLMKWKSTERVRREGQNSTKDDSL